MASINSATKNIAALSREIPFLLTQINPSARRRNHATFKGQKVHTQYANEIDLHASLTFYRLLGQRSSEGNARALRFIGLFH